MDYSANDDIAFFLRCRRTAHRLRADIHYSLRVEVFDATGVTRSAAAWRQMPRGHGCAPNAGGGNSMTREISCESISAHADFLKLVSVENLHVNLRYASTANFMGRDMYSPLDCAWAHKDAISGLSLSVAWLAQHAPGLRLCVLDALRPQRVQEAMWAHLEGTPLTQYLAPPEIGSIHSFGMAIDATLVDADGHELDMGTPFDDMTELSHPTLEARFLKSGALHTAQIRNRQLLRDAMRSGGFNGIGTEWWHFDCGDRALVRAHYARVL